MLEHFLASVCSVNRLISHLPGISTCLTSICSLSTYISLYIYALMIDSWVSVTTKLSRFMGRCVLRRLCMTPLARVSRAQIFLYRKWRCVILWIIKNPQVSSAADYTQLHREVVLLIVHLEILFVDLRRQTRTSFSTFSTWIPLWSQTKQLKLMSRNTTPLFRCLLCLPSLLSCTCFLLNISNWNWILSVYLRKQSANLNTSPHLRLMKQCPLKVESTSHKVQL